MGKAGKKFKTMWIALSLIAIILIGIHIFIRTKPFGRLPHGERLERVENSVNYRDGKFQNLSETQQLTSDKGFFRNLVEFLFCKIDRLRPDIDIPVVKTDLKSLNPSDEVVVWLGHSSYFIQTSGRTFLVDPVFNIASPVSFFNKAFKGTNMYRAEDMPDIDYIVITHDHWDHLDYKILKELMPRTGHIVCPLGVGEHLEYWGYAPSSMIEMDWYEEERLNDDITIFCLPARHFSGRGTKPNQSLWASFMIEAGERKIYLGGDGGYDTHFAEIGRDFAPVDLAIMENGQYDTGWKYIHLMPQDLVKAIKDISPARVMTVHNSKYALSKHEWDEPLRNISAAAQKDSINLLTPMIGEIVDLNDTTQVFSRWWEAKE